MKINFNKSNEDIIFFCAFRYCLGRRTYVVRTMVDEIIENWDNMPKSRKEMFKQEICEAVNYNRAGSKYDVVEWEKILRLENGND